jgi:hypothetical protein
VLELPYDYTKLDDITRVEFDKEFANYQTAKSKGVAQEKVVSDDNVLELPYDSDEGCDDDFLKFNENKGIENVQRQTGLTFSSVKVSRAALQEYLIKEGIQPKYLKNNTKKKKK